MLKSIYQKIIRLYLKEISIRFQIGLSVFSQGINAISLLVLSMFLARYLSKNDYGTYQQIQLIASTIVVFSLFGLPQSLYYFIPKVVNAKKIVSRTFLLCIGAGFVIGGVAWLLDESLSIWMNNLYIKQLAYIYFLLVLTQIPLILFESVFISIGYSNRFYIINILFSVTIFIAVMLPLLLTSGIKYILISLVANNLMTFIILYISYSKSLKHNPEVAKPETISLSSQYAYALPVGLSFIVGIIGKQVDRYLISIYFTPADFAVYSRGAMEIPLIPMVIYSISNILMPRLVIEFDKGNKDDAMEIWQKSIIYGALISFPFFVLLYHLSGDLMTLLYSERYLASSQVFRGYLFLLIIQITSYGGFARVIGKPGLIFCVALIMIPINIASGILFLPKFGFLGPVIATVLSNFAASQIFIVSFSKILQIPYTHIFPWEKLGKILCLSLVASLLFPLLSMISHFSKFYRIILNSSIYFGVYFILSYSLKTIPITEREYVANVISKLKRTMLQRKRF